MKKMSIIFAALGLFVAASCSKVEMQPVVEPARDLVPLSILSGEKASQQAALKTTLSGTEVHWTEGDAVAVFDKLNYKNEFPSVAVSGSSARFEGQVENGTTEFYAVYPFSSALSADASNLYVNLPSDQTPVAGTFAEEMNVSVAAGSRTPGEPEVTGLRFRNVCGLIYFTVPARLNAVSEVVFKAENRALAGELTIAKSDVTTVAAVSSGSNSVKMTGDFAAGSTFYFVVAPGKVQGFSITVKTKNGATYTNSSVKSFDLASGAMKNLGTIDFKSQPTAVAEHTYENGILTGTKVTFNLGLPEKMEQYVENMQVSMYNSNETEVRNLIWDNPVASTNLSVVGNNLYLPQGDYTVKCTYTLNGVDEYKEFLVEVNAPVIRATASAYTSYSKYLQNKKDEANGCQPETIYDVKYSINVSDAVLAQYPMTSCSGAIYDANGSAINPVSSATDPSMLKKSTFYSQAEQKVTNWGKYTAKTTVTFDDETATSEAIDLHITGLPYDSPNFYNTSVSMASTSSAAYNQWAYSGNVVYWKSHGYQVIYWYSKVTAGVMFSPEFKIPSATKINYYISACYFTTGLGTPTITVYSGATTNFTKSTSNAYDLKRIASNLNPKEDKFTQIPHALTLNPASRLSIGTDEQKDGNLAECWATIRSLVVDYDYISK